ncbi:MAG: class I SAM-dependent methyltransferase [Planctomycetaceae bacterium]|nr:class I SAM-dependent methyltransferase [Planctomycetaceae bacterium]
MNSSLDDYRWLVSDAAAPWLVRVREELAAVGGPSAALVNRLRKDLSAQRAHLVIEQCELRERAREKFALAERMFFTGKGLEQATDQRVAAAKAARFPAGRVADLCCGIGGDSLALARRTASGSSDEQLSAVELDPAVAAIAAANLRVGGCTRAAVETADAAAFPVGQCAAWHIDPDRRAEGRRTSRVELYAPSLESLRRLLGQNSNAAIKLAPAAQAPPDWRESAELCWLGSRGECRQQVAWFGSLARRPGEHSACVVDARGGERTIVGQPEEAIPVARALARYLYEPHAAVLAAKIAGAICRMHALAAVSPGVAYLTSDASIDEPAADSFEILDVLPLDRKRLREYLRQRHIGRLEIKKRGVPIDPAKLRQEVIGAGEGEAMLVVSRVGGRVDGAVQAMVVRRVNPTP